MLTSVHTGSSGSWSRSVTVPEATGGSHPVTADGAVATFNVDPVGTISISRGSVGTRVNVSGDGFGASQAINITFGAETVETKVTDSVGSIDTNFTVPSVAAGSYTVKVGNAPSSTFIVSSSFAIAPAKGPPGTQRASQRNRFRPQRPG